jgi:hypothetical protein
MPSLIIDRVREEELKHQAPDHGISYKESLAPHFNPSQGCSYGKTSQPLQDPQKPQ